eukprot:495964_1
MAACRQSFTMWILLLLWRPLFALNDVSSLTITIADDQNATTHGLSHVTLWYNFTVYRYSLNQTLPSQPYSAYQTSTPRLQILGRTHCEYTTNPTDSQVMIEHDHANPIKIDKILFHTASGHWYGIDKFVQNGTTKATLCVNNQSTTCGPSKQILHFDITRPNQWILDALWSTGSNVTPHIQTCQTKSLSTTAFVDFVTSETTALNLLGISLTRFTIMIAGGLAGGCICFIVICVACRHGSKKKKLGSGKSLKSSKSHSDVDMLRTYVENQDDDVPLDDPNKPNDYFYDTRVVIEWIENTLKLPFYKQNFLQNGYESMKSIIAIGEEAQLHEIGISQHEHIVLIMSEIAQLRNMVQGNKDSPVFGYADTMKTEPVFAKNQTVNTIVLSPILSSRNLIREMNEMQYAKQRESPSTSQSSDEGDDADDAVLGGIELKAFDIHDSRCSPKFVTKRDENDVLKDKEIKI